uniref:Nudix hydrolase domain-containing protein n=1 Tax=viral metagenome TaxID=1070528 RepID=A0A6C0EGL2_9ZZZZ
MSNSTSVCNNCGKNNHNIYQCKLPITSYGVIVFKINNNILNYLMIRRKNSFGYIDFIKGKYSINNIEQIQNNIDEMSNYEKTILGSQPFDFLWKQLWCENVNLSNYKNEEYVCSKKFDAIKNGIMIDNKQVILDELLENSKTNWTETEWEFPKGRKNYQERDIDCALREFEEETGISKENINIIENVLPFEEIYVGSNHKIYKHKYFLGLIKNSDSIGSNNSTIFDSYSDYDLTLYQQSEVSKLEWKTIEQCLESIRPYNLEKKTIITNVNKILQEFILCQ